MLNSKDQQNIRKASQTSGLLVQELRSIALQSQSPLLAQIARDILQEALWLQQWMKRLKAIVRDAQAQAYAQVRSSKCPYAHQGKKSSQKGR